MFRRIRNRITYTNVVLTFAFLFLMTGGAYAAKRYIITSTGQISPKVIHALEGKSGPAGPPGPAGPKGEPGARGPVGPAGTASVAEAASTKESGLQGPPGPQGPEGKQGKEGEEGGEGPEGPAGPAGPEGVCAKANCTLPAGSSEKGVWTLDGPPSAEPFLTGVQASISYTIPLKETPTAKVIAKGEEPPEGCKGTPQAPEAEPGNLCIFTLESINVLNLVPLHEFTVGVVLIAEPKEGNSVFANGTWAVTAKE